MRIKINNKIKTIKMWMLKMDERMVEDKNDNATFEGKKHLRVK